MSFKNANYFCFKNSVFSLKLQLNIMITFFSNFGNKSYCITLSLVNFYSIKTKHFSMNLAFYFTIDNPKNIFDP